MSATLKNLCFFKNRIIFLTLFVIIFVTDKKVSSFSCRPSPTKRAIGPIISSSSSRPLNDCYKRQSPRLSLSSDLNNSSNKMQSKGTSKLSLGYKALSFGYAFQVWLTLVKSRGLSLAVANAIGGPLVASGILHQISKSTKNLANDTIKQLNGLLILYASIGLSMVALLPPTTSIFEWLWCLCSAGTLISCFRGYLSGALESASKADSLKENLKMLYRETLRLNIASQQSVWSKPTNLPTVVYSAALPIILLMKLSLGIELIQLVLSSSPAYALVGRLSQLAKLTILGGSTVILKSLVAKNEPFDLELSTISRLQLLTAYIYFTTAGEQAL
jgi:hypothetical protein